MERSVLAGRPEEPDTPFVVLYRTAVPLVTEVQEAPRERYVTVLDGTLEIGLADDPAPQKLGPGSYAVIPRGVRHFLRCAAGSLLQIHGLGPLFAA